MRQRQRMTISTAVALGCSILATSVSAEDDSWPGFRGMGDSRTAIAELPIEWGDHRNLAWSRELAGYGQSSPVVWNSRAFVTSVKGTKKETLVVTCVDIETGLEAWHKEFPASQTGEPTDYVSKGAPTPAIDARHIYAFFESGDLIALTHAGEPLWTRSLTKDYGEIQGNHGLGSSPAQTDSAVVILVEHGGPSYLAAFDKRTGTTLWKNERPSRVSWSSPVTSAGPAGDQIFISSNGVSQCFAAATGDLVWEVKQLHGNTVASPTVSAGSVLIGSGQPGHSLLIRRGGAGDVTASHVAWRAEGVSSSFGSPLVSGDRAYFVNKAGAAFAVDLRSGKTLWTVRLPDSTWASPIGNGERVWFFCRNGTTVVVRDSDTFEKLAENALHIDGRVYGVAAVPGGFLIRSSHRLSFVREAGQ